VTPVPDTVIVVAPVKPLPESMTGTLVPLTPVAGAIDASVGAAGLTTVNVSVLLVPPGVVTLTVLALAVAVAEIANVAVTVVLLTTVRPLYVTPAPDTVIVVAPVRSVPVSVTGTLVPLVPELGAIANRVGPNTVNISVLLVPPGVVTLTVLALAVAVAEIVNVVVTVVELTTVTVPTVTPGPDTATVVPIAPKFVPVKVTGTAVPCWPLLGATEVSVGPAGLTTVSVKL
jgi:hypothetical protein